MENGPIDLGLVRRWTGLKAIRLIQILQVRIQLVRAQLLDTLHSGTLDVRKSVGQIATKTRLYFIRLLRILFNLN